MNAAVAEGCYFAALAHSTRSTAPNSPITSKKPVVAVPRRQNLTGELKGHEHTIRGRKYDHTSTLL